MNHHHASEAPNAIRLGISGLPTLTDCLTPGGVYALIAETPPTRFPILAASLGIGLRQDTICSIVLPGQPGQFLDRLKAFGQLELHALLETARLSVFEMQDEFQNKMFRLGAEALVRELEHFGIPEDGYLIFDQADEALSLHDHSLALDQINVLCQWAEQRRVTVLLVFSRLSAEHSSAINALMDNLSGIVRLGSDKIGLELTFDYWQSPEGTVAARTYPVRRNDSGLYEVCSVPVPAQGQALTQSNATPETSEASSHYFYMDPDLGSLAQQLPGVWQRVDTLVGMLHATQAKRSATLVLTFYRNTSIRQLAEAAHTLRLSLGQHVRIVVQEKGASLRYQNEALLLRLGVNLVVHRDVPVNRLPLLLESLNGQIFSRDVNINFEAALASVLPTRMRGYVSAARFVREAEQILQLAETLHIPCALVVGKPRQPRSVIELLNSCAFSRPGDLLSSDGELCFFFLNACPQSALLPTLNRILSAAPDDALQDIRFAISADEIAAELSVLIRASERGGVPDYSEQVALPPVTEAAPEPAPGGEVATRYPAVDTRRPASLSAASPLTDSAGGVEPQAVRPGAFTQDATMAPSNMAPVAATADLISQARETLASTAETSADLVQFSYDKNAKENAFGRREVPRAVRRAARSQEYNEAESTEHAEHIPNRDRP